MEAAARLGTGGDPVDFTVRKITSAEFFRPIFDEGMSLVSETALYLDGAGKQDSAHLPTGPKIAYLGLSMRLVACLTHLASWLMLHRAVQEGEITILAASADPQRPRVSDLGSLAEARDGEGLPPRMAELADRVHRFRTRMEAIELALYGDPAASNPNPVLQRIALIEAAFTRS